MKLASERTCVSPFSLDAVNFLAADVRGALGSYLNVFLVTRQKWSRSEVGLVTTLGGLLGFAVLTVMAVIIFAWPGFWPVAIATSVMAVWHAESRAQPWCEKPPWNPPKCSAWRNSPKCPA